MADLKDNILRQSQLITTYGPGSMVDLPECSVIVSGLRDWSFIRSDKISEPRLVAKLCRHLGLPSLDLRTPPRHDDNADQKKALVGARIFPTWFIVNEDHPSPRNPQWRRRKLVQWKHLRQRRFIDEDGKRKPVVPVRFVCGCPRGHIDDLDWRAYVHQSNRTCHRPLWLEERGVGGSIGDTFCVCECGEERALYESSGPDSAALGFCEGKRPWIGAFAKESCNQPYRLLVRTASNAYFPQVMSVISLPEFDEGLAAKVSSHFDRLKVLDDVGFLDNFRNSPELAAAFSGVADATVLEEYRRQKTGGASVAEKPLKTSEFDILDTGDRLIGEDDPRSRFFAETLDRKEWDPDIDPALAAVDKLVLVHRLREVMALVGFTRFEAVSPDKDGELDLNVTRADLAEDITWLPAVENRGEGLFMSFDRGEIEKWLGRSGVRAREKTIETAWVVWARKRQRPEDGFPGAAYVMLHSLSHMLMTSIALECGYPASSLRERVYAHDSGYGILIYTGSSDSEGTLGGLIESGRHLADHLRRALEAGELCSNDPVCAEHMPDASLEGRSLLGAACHGCLLIAETSCEQRNDFLDRAFVVPTVSTGDAAFFNGLSSSP